MPYKPSSIWTHKRQNKFQTECISADCEVTAFSFKKYKDGMHFHDAGWPEGFDEWWEVEGLELIRAKADYGWDGEVAEDFKYAAQLGWESAINAKLS